MIAWETFYLDDAKQLRDEALERVTRPDWQERALVAMRFLNGFTGTAEDIRVKLITGGLDKPHHHNAWGALIRHAIRLHMLSPTGQYRNMRTSRSHARKTPVYTVEQ